MKLDRIDIAILERLQEDARITNSDLAREVNLTPTPCLYRVRALQEAGVIRGHVTLVDPRPGPRLNVFIQVTLEKQARPPWRHSRRRHVRPEVMECYLMTGDSDYLLRVLVRDIQALEHFILEGLTKIPGIANVRSSFALKQVRYKTAVPLLPQGMELNEP